MTHQLPKHLSPLPVDNPIWDHFYTVAPLILVGSQEPDGHYNIAPKHMAMPVGWDNYYCFVCTPRHGTYHNIQRTRQFTVSYPRPTQLLQSSLAAAPRVQDDAKPSLVALPTFRAAKVDGVLVEGGYLFLECELDRIVDGFGDNSLVIGNVVFAAVDEDALRRPDRDDNELIYDDPLLAYLHPGRMAEIRQSHAFPFPAGFSR